MRAAVLALAFDGLGAEVATSGAIEGNAARGGCPRSSATSPTASPCIAPRGTPVLEHRYRLGVSAGSRIAYPVRIEHLDECRALFGLDAQAGRRRSP